MKKSGPRMNFFNCQNFNYNLGSCHLLATDITGVETLGMGVADVTLQTSVNVTKHFLFVYRRGQGTLAIG